MKRDLGKLIRRIADLVGFDRCYNLLMARLEHEIALAKEHADKPVVWVNIHGVLLALEQVVRNMEEEDVPKLNRLLFILFELPQDKIAFRLVTTEIIIDLSYCLGAMSAGPTQELIAETQKYYTYVIEGLSIETARQ